MVISQFGKIIRIDTKTIRAAGRATQGVRLLNLGAGRQGSRRRHHPARRAEGRRPLGIS
jgi:DNA gyrase/topoisomerase IV subunit A